MQLERPNTQLSLAILFVILAALLNTIMLVFVKITSHSLPIQVILFARYLITLIIVLPFIVWNSDNIPAYHYVKTDRPYLHLVRDGFGLASAYCYFYATQHLTLADATILYNSAPLFVPIVSYFWGGYKIYHRLWWGIGLGFIGVIFLLHPGKQLFHLYSMLGLLSGIFLAIVYVGSRYLLYTEPPLRNMFYYFSIGTLFAFIILLLSDVSVTNSLTIHSSILLLAIGLFGYLFQFCFTKSAKYAPVRLTSSFLYIGVVFSIIADWIVWKLVPNLFSIIGFLLVIIGAFLMLILYPHGKDVKQGK